MGKVSQNPSDRLAGVKGKLSGRSIVSNSQKGAKPSGNGNGEGAGFTEDSSAVKGGCCGGENAACSIF